MTAKLPKAVSRLVDATSEKLGRPAHYRKVNNQHEWYINDPVFSFVQRGMRKGKTGYRVGYNINTFTREIRFVLVHSPLIAQLFKRNLVLDSLISVLQSTQRFREFHWVYRSSKQSVLSGFDGDRIEGDTFTEFVQRLRQFDEQSGFIKDLFPKRHDSKKDEKGLWAGNTFYALLSDRAKVFSSLSAISEIVDRTWPLFLCLYPVEPIEKRSASLARGMRAAKIPIACEFARIMDLDRLVGAGEVSPLCRGEIQGAHIKPDALGGSDRPENGMWLCEYHHRATEGKLAGRRNGTDLDVRVV